MSLLNSREILQFMGTSYTPICLKLRQYCSQPIAFVCTNHKSTALIMVYWTYFISLWKCISTRAPYSK